MWPRQRPLGALDMGEVDGVDLKPSAWMVLRSKTRPMVMATMSPKPLSSPLITCPGSDPDSNSETLRGPVRHSCSESGCPELGEPLGCSCCSSFKCRSCLSSWHSVCRLARLAGSSQPRAGVAVNRWCATTPVLNTSLSLMVLPDPSSPRSHDMSQQCSRRPFKDKLLRLHLPQLLQLRRLVKQQDVAQQVLQQRIVYRSCKRFALCLGAGY